ncbi:transcription initiation factor tfiid subunit 8-like [Nannochloropsis oceanica]
MALPIPSAVTATSTSCSHLPLQPQAQRQRQRGAADTFALAVTRQAVAQAALAVGCKHTYPSVLDALTDMVRDFIIALGTEAQTKAESGGRTRVTLLDVLAALDEPQQETGRDRYELDWRALRGFAFRGDLTQLDQPEAFQWYQPFHTHIPPFPVCSGSSGSGIAPSDGLERALPVEGGGEVMCSSGAENGAGAAASGEEGRMWPPYVPSFLPAFPPQHTFRKTSLKASSKMEDPVAIQRHRIATKQLILKAIARQKTTSGKSTTCSGIVERDEAKKTEVLGSLSSSVSSSHAVPKRATCDRPLPNKDEEADEDLLFSSDAQDSRPVATALEVFTAESK